MILFFVENVHNGYELEKVFGVQANLLSRQFDEDVWQELIKNKKNGISIPQSFLDMGVNIRMITEEGNPFGFNPFRGRVEHLLSADQFYPDIFMEKGIFIITATELIKDGWRHIVIRCWRN